MRRVLLIGLIVASVVMMTVYGREGETGPLHTLQSAVSGAVSPLRIVGGSIESATSTVGDTVDNITADQSTLSGLREYNEQLVQQYSQMEEYKQEAQRLQKLLDLKDTYQIEGTGARVIGRSSEAWSQTVIINKGSDDGVSTGQTVMGTSGVVGQIVSTSSHTATVRLLTDPQSGAAAMVQSSRAEGILRGSLVGLLYLEDLDADFVKKVKKGDIIVAEENFGCGSSREHAPIAIKAAGVDAVIAKSFARIFYRNSINTGLALMECPEAVDAIKQGDVVDVDADAGVITNTTTGETFKAQPFPPFIREIIEEGGLINRTKKVLGK